MKTLYADVWPLRRASARKRTAAEREYAARVSANKRRLKRAAKVKI